MLLILSLLRAAAAAVAALVHNEKAIPPLLADQLPKADSMLVEKAGRRRKDDSHGHGDDGRQTPIWSAAKHVRPPSMGAPIGTTIVPLLSEI